MVCWVLSLSAVYYSSILSLASSIAPSASSSSAAVAAVTSTTAVIWVGRAAGIWDLGWKREGRDSTKASQMVGRLIWVTITCIFAIVGSFVGAMTGALIGLATESGLFRGAGIGSISGAVFSIEVIESSVALWRSDGSGMWSFLYMIDIVSSILNGRLVREKVGPAVQSAIQSQMSAVDSPFIEALDIFDTGGTKGMSKDSVDMLPKIKISTENNVGSSSDRICCSVCLQDFQVGETVRSLPHCQHMFHLPCIDDWLIRHGSCPLCRRGF